MAQNSEKQPFFSIISVTLNNADGLLKTKSSIDIQNFAAFEWIVIDGGSSDQTLEILKNSTARWTSAQDKGIYDAMNKGIEAVNGHYVLFLNAGDQLAAPETLSKIHEALIENPALFYGDAMEDGNYKSARNPEIKRGMFTHHQSMLYRADILKTMRYDTRYKIAADYDLTARILQNHPHLQYAPIPVCIFETGGVSQKQAALGRFEQLQIRKRLKLCSLFENLGITSAQALLWRVRMWFPALYWRLKSSGNTAPASTQNDTPAHHPKTPA